MKTLFPQISKILRNKQIVIALLTLFCANISQANFGTSQQVVSLLPLSSANKTPDWQDSGANFIINFVPGGFLFSPDLDGFKIRNYSGYYYYEEEIVGIGSWMPNLRLGVRINAPVVSFDITGGGGYLLNGALSGPFALADFAANFHIGPKFSIGPHVGIISFGDLDWWYFDNDYDDYGDVDEPDVTLDGSTGLMGGLAMTIGNSTANFYLALDYIQAEFDVEADHDWEADSDELDLSGFGLQLGLLLKF